MKTKIAYYNEIDKTAVAWLKELIKNNLIAPGDVDDRSILEVRPADLKDYSQCHFFAGIGVWSHALRQAGWPDDKQVWTGSCPCQPFSEAGKRKGIDDERHLWPAWEWLIGQCKPNVIFGEQVASKAGISWLDLVSTDLEGQGYAVAPIVLPACGVGAPHQRKRIWFVADTDSRRREQRVEKVGRLSKSSPGRPINRFWSDAEWIACTDKKWRPVKPGLEPLVDGTSGRVGLLRGYGNAIVAPLAQEIISAYLEVRVV